MVTLKKFLAISEAQHHTLSGNKLDFPNDMDVKDIILTRTDTHEIAKLITEYAVIETYRDMVKEKDKADKYNQMADDDDKEEYDFSVKEFASRASDNAYDFAAQIREQVLNMKDSDFVEIIKHFFPDHK